MDIVENRRKRLRKWFADKPIPQKEKSFLSQLMGGKASFGEKAARRIERDYSMPFGYLDGNHQDGGSEMDVRENRAYRVEVLDLSVSAGPGRYMLTEVVEILHAIEFTSDHARSLFGSRNASNIKVMTVDGDSMSPTIRSGDRLFFDVSIREFKTDGVYAFVYGRTFHVKRLQMQGTKLAVLSDNPNLEKWYIEEATQDQFYVMGKALIHESVMYGKL
ncbi:S24 family peptidase [Serratia symbiotica]|uniref:S24 family peptidase n=1 Tax=Serratia symbiotica TaxID=138074 RepID=UPI001CEFC4FE|nr:S24 family peptidase [Serratia symbiotica]